MTNAPTPLDLSRVRIRPLPDNRALSRFCCGVREIDGWARSKCAKLHSKRRARVFCAFNGEAQAAIGFYALSLKPESEDHLEQCHSGWRNASKFIPLVYIDYIAVQNVLQSQKLGTFLLMDVLMRAYHIANNVSVYGVALRSLNERTTSTYRNLGFAIKDDEKPHPLMIMPIWTVLDLIEKTSSREPS